MTLEKLRSMRLFGMYDAFKASLENTLKEQMPQDRFVFHLVSGEWDNRRNRAIVRAVKAAPFRYNASPEEMDYSFERGGQKPGGASGRPDICKGEKGPFHCRTYRNRQKR